MIVIVDYGLGNLHSILYKLHKFNIESKISCDPEEIEKAHKLILPGVGAFGVGMSNLKQSGLIPVLSKKVLEQKTPILGICLGMQLFTRHSEEGDAQGLGWIDAQTKRFNFNSLTIPLRIPHMGWNNVTLKQSVQWVEKITKDDTFYFVHSYHLVADDPSVILGTTNYGYDFVSMVHKDNIYGTQFHPEKSHKNGVELLINFCKTEFL